MRPECEYVTSVTWAARINSGQGHEKAADAGLSGSLALGVGHLPVIRTPWVALSPDHIKHSETKHVS